MTEPLKGCPCCSGNDYTTCCQPFHAGRLPKDALQLMRSRYAAYALNLVDYIIATTHPASPHYAEDQSSWKHELSDFAKNTTFHRLEVRNFKEKGPLATVTFTAYLFEGPKDSTFTERSYFEKVKGQWLYRAGELLKLPPKN
jgi:SEC-C motif-containing protein